ncbi:MAG: nitroreductase family protein [Geodermatophilaceae bacterium]
MNEATDGLLHPLLSSRWNPRTFDQSRDITATEVESLLEAARWAPSAGNSQPWRSSSAAGPSHPRSPGAASGQEGGGVGTDRGIARRQPLAPFR